MKGPPLPGRMYYSYRYLPLSLLLFLVTSATVVCRVSGRRSRDRRNTFNVSSSSSKGSLGVDPSPTWTLTEAPHKTNATFSLMPVPATATAGASSSSICLDEKYKNTWRLPPFDDPLFPLQWYLVNRRKPGHDLNVLPVWHEGVTGKGVVVALIDDGVDFEHGDLAPAYRADLSYDFNRGKQPSRPDPRHREHHGTRCAGQIAGRANNSICGVGIAPEAQISVIGILTQAVSSRNEAAAVTHKYHDNQIYSCSWGPADNGKAIDGPDAMVLRAFIKGLTQGRSGRGSIYVFAAGNGGQTVDNCNYDGYASGMFALTVGAIDHDHRMPRYMEPCAAQLVVAYSSNDEYKIATTDLGGHQCTLKHGGTSAAAPMVTGILALALSVNPSLTWRDVRYLCVEAALPISISDASWVRNSAGRWYSHHFGFGRVDAHKLVTLARTWKSVPRQAVRSLPVKTVNASIGERPIMDSIDITPQMMGKFKLDDLTMLEYVTVRLNIEHSCRGDVLIFLRSPGGTQIPLATRRPLDRSGAGLKGITMMTVAFWGEKIRNADVNRWTLVVTNAPHARGHGRLLDYRLAFWGPLRESVMETDEEYSKAFLYNYYPPSEDYFEDKDGIFDVSGSGATNRTHAQTGNQREMSADDRAVLLLAGSFALLLLLAASCRLILRLIQRRRGFAPIPPSFNTSQPMVPVFDEKQQLVIRL